MHKIVYVVVDTDNKFILFFAPSRLTAFMLARGMLNSHAMEFVMHPDWLSGWVENVDRENDMIHLKNAGYPVRISPLPDCQIRDEIMEKRRLLAMRSRYLYDLELLCQVQLTRAANFFDESMVSFVQEQLNLSDPDNDNYAPGIQEYAYINEITPEAAYQELSMRLQSTGMIKLRVQAFYDKYSRVLTTLSDEKEFEKTMTTMKYELYMNSYV